MGTKSKGTIKTMLANDIMEIFNRCTDVKKSIDGNLEDTLDYFNTLIAQIPQSASGPLITKTPKVLKKRGKPRVQTIPEDDVICADYTMSDSIATSTRTEKSDGPLSGRPKREASKKAADNIKKQQSMSLATKLRRTNDNDVIGASPSKKRSSQTKRKKSARSSSDEDESRGPTKHSKVEDNANRGSKISVRTDLECNGHYSANETLLLETDRKSSTASARHSNRKRSHSRSITANGKRANIINETVIIAPLVTDEEPSLYEDAIEKPTPIMNSTMNVNSTIVLHKMMNSTVVLEPLPMSKAGTNSQETRNVHKANHPLFSPYAKESVKKRVEAFEQATLNSPKPAVEIDAPTRVTRTKTRAIAAAQSEVTDSGKLGEKMVAQKLARKSLARAKKISLAKQVKDTDEYKENKVQSAQKIHKLVPTDKTNQKQKTTPLGKTKIQLPMSVSRIPQTPNNQLASHYSKALSAARANIVISVDSFVQAPKTASKPTSAEKLEEKRRNKVNDEDAKRKREDALRLQTEEKRRKREEKELKNKLAREAKMRLDMEKRQRAERDREEKARLAQQIYEKQREEMERKRLAQLQRAQEKEERRRVEEQLRQQRFQEAEEAERLLAEHRRREQDAERRREAETRAQQQAAAEAMKIKHQMLAAQAKTHMKHGPTNYILDSEPDDDNSDDEHRPKHPIPHWAQPQVRQAQLAIQRYTPQEAVFKFFDARKCTPDLTELFQGIDRSRLKRTSSAVWKTPPRYSMMEAE